ncbi:MAG: hypothetical protein ETSY1_27920 [Candidatus Entotheonella factor]|uniref:Uncharacterized protein n=1 Tax=Entotheonella factor TaxID=1429438 RepID=W4LDN0_ENTF1|nr:MAG: hypothetical protein ETSY1_27920 [Candidatus Entotheonella factor]
MNGLLAALLTNTDGQGGMDATPLALCHVD